MEHSHDPQNPISNETGEYLPEVAAHTTEEQLKAQDDLNAENDKPARALKTNTRRK